VEPNQPESNGPNASSSPNGWSAPARVKAVALMGGVSLERGVPLGEIYETIRDAANLVWVDIQDPGPAELAVLLEELGFHPLALEDVAKGEQRPKVDEYKGHLFLVVYALRPEPDDETRSVELDLFIGRNYVVSLHRGPIAALDEAYARWTRGGALLREGVGFLVYTLLDALIDAYLPAIGRIEEAVAELELEMFERSRRGDVQALLRLRRSLVRLRRVLFPLREIFGVLLRRDQPLFPPQTLVYFQDVHDHLLRILDALDSERELVSGALDAQLSLLSTQLNQTMRALALVTAVVAIAGLTFGAYGMNFRVLPLADAPWGFAAVVGGTLALISLVLWIARRRGWL
jgi:magnesium transporter